MHQYRVVEIKNLEPLKIGARGNQSIYSEPSKEHIPGSTIRGAIIGEMIRLKLFTDEAKNNILLNMECYNAYPYFSDALYLPTPFHLRIDKHKWREGKTKEMEPKLELSNLLKEKEEGKNQLEYPFVTVKDNKLFGKRIKKEYRFHHFKHNPDSKDKEKENIFRYQAISPGQTFKAIIRYDEVLEEEMETLFKNPLLLYLGGSKGSGYGKSEIIATKSMVDFKEVKKELGLTFDKENKKNEIIITCFSDCLFRNEFGQPVNYIPEGYFSGLDDGEVKLERQFIQTGKTEGYNSTWKARYPKETTLKAGSVLKYVFEKELTETEISKIIDSIEKRPIGSRTQDGYGWLGVNIKYPEHVNISEDSPFNEEVTENKININSLAKDDKVDQTFHILLSGLDEAKKRWLSTLYSLMKNEDTAENIIRISKELKKSQLRNMEDLIEEFLESGEIETENNIILDRHYTNDNNYFSLNGYNLKVICEFLNGNNEKLKEFADKKLNSQQGKLFYYKEKKDKKDKKFIADLVKRALYIERMRGK